MRDQISPQKHLTRQIPFIGAVLLVLIFIQNAFAQPVRVGPLTAELISPMQSIQPGVPFEVGLNLVPDPEWHVYWKNPGDAGMAPKLKWNLPEGFSAGEFVWPAPERIEQPPLASYGYHGEALYPLTITPPADLQPGQQINLEARAEWLVCKEKCLPGEAELSLSLPVSADAASLNENWSALFDDAANRTPQPLPDDWQVQATLSDWSIVVDIHPPARQAKPLSLDFFAAKAGMLEHTAIPATTISDDFWRMELTRSAYSQGDPEKLEGVLEVLLADGSHYYQISTPFGKTITPAAVATSSLSGFWLAMLFAFLGGLVLNLMPCVLPVLSLKVLGLVQQAGQGRRASLRHGLMFTSGVLVTFWVVVAVLFLLQAGGTQLGWGFQLQSPVFVMVLAGLLFLFALNLFGVFEIGFLSGTANKLHASANSGSAAAFLSGITATILATPCTAPFMGAALGYSLTQPPLLAWLIYTSLALGMASPYLLLSGFPKLLRFVPKPGRWMETLKQFLAFPLLATVIWLGWVLASQAGQTAVLLLLTVLLLLALAAWIFGRWGVAASRVGIRLLGRAIGLVIIVGTLLAGAFSLDGIGYARPSSVLAAQGSIIWEEFSQRRLDELRAGGRPIFLDFTAAWCLSCQVNERVAFSSEAVQERFASLQVVALKADWTTRSEEITRALASYGRNSVPLYVLYAPDSAAEPIILPEILTPGIVLEALAQIDNQRQISQF
ncbi:MAG: protein-disulfide reductase DsbD domain-containing protein [bacterium]